MASADGDDKELAGKIGYVFGEFVKLYLPNLARLFCLIPGDITDVMSHLTMCMSVVAQHGEEHLKFTSVAPFYWIEPTSLTRYKNASLPAVCEGFGTLVGTNEVAKMPYFEGLHSVKPSALFSDVVVQFRSARTCGMVLHHYKNACNGLTAVKLTQAADTEFCHRGGVDEPISTSMLRGANFREYLWERGDAGVPAPSELLYIGNNVGLKLEHGFFDPVTETITPTGLVSSMEVNSDYPVTIRASSPSYIKLMSLSDKPRKQVRARTIGSMAIEAEFMFRCTGRKFFTTRHTAPKIPSDMKLVTSSVIQK